MTKMAPASRAAWSVVALLWVVAMLNYVDRLVITTMHDPIVAELPMTEAQFGLLTSVFLWVYGLMSPLCGFLADRFSRRKVIFASLLTWSTVTWMTGHVHSYTALLWTRAMMGVSEACYIPAALALIADHHRGDTRSLATGIHNSGVYFGIVVGGLGGYMAVTMGWRIGFMVLGGAGAAYSVVLIMFLQDAPVRLPADSTLPAKTVRVRAALGALFQRRDFRLLLMVSAFVSAANWTIYGWLPTYLREHFRLGLGEAGLSATAYVQVASFIGIVVGGAWADRWSRTQPRARILVPAVGYCMAAPALYLAGASDVLAVALGGLMLFGVGRGFYDANLMPIVRQAVDERYSATAYGFLNAVGCVVGGGMTYAGGALRDAHIDLSVVIRAGALGLLATSLLLYVIRPRPESFARSNEVS
ncbi:MAG: major facilitator superfamily 1 [Verrucomicrobia bacterium]|nr:major facilitator superfamily 1 [Verrucomicrobiota bacterium]